ncbi:MAG TPA: septation ring formation regulator EzrA [Erysipelotrichaceae bacterium]|nr:septation ring formation regulator EzrA [Erysipelotrichaceae bacterium]HBZ40636.1 septation ring formation regulator EzrA [Erysipelotrichaceae bacterium]
MRKKTDKCPKNPQQTSIYDTITTMRWSSMDMQLVLDILAQPTTVMTVGGLFSIALLFLIARRVRKGNLKKKLKELEIRYNNVRSIPLPFKLNKAVALARVNAEVASMTEKAKVSFEAVQNELKQIANLLAETEDAILMGKLKAAKLTIGDIAGMIDRTTLSVEDLEKKLDGVLEEETQQRSKITDLKDQFRSLKGEYSEKSASLSLCIETLDQRMAEIEKSFSMFEEWMYASEFGKAKEKMEEIATQLEDAESLVTRLPELIALAKGVIPKQMDEIAQLYSQLKQKGVFLQHLEVPKNLELVSDTLKEDITNLRRGVVEQVEVHLADNRKRLEQLMAQLDREDRAHFELYEAIRTCVKNVKECSELYQNLKITFQKVSVRFGWDDLKDVLKTSEGKLLAVDENVQRLRKLSEEHSIPATTLLISVKETLQDVNVLGGELQNAMNRVNGARSDEERANKQLLKLHIIMNEIQVKIRKHRLPSISSAYEEDMRKSYQFVNSIEKLLEENPLNINLLNATVTDAIDTIYKLYNNVNNIVGTVEMVENAIVFGNKYRSFYPEIDDQLTRSELLFHNGDYTEAIKVAIGAIEKVHPISYEKLIKENSKSATS